MNRNELFKELAARIDGIFSNECQSSPFDSWNSVLDKIQQQYPIPEKRDDASALELELQENRKRSLSSSPNPSLAKKLRTFSSQNSEYSAGNNRQKDSLQDISNSLNSPSQHSLHHLNPIVKEIVPDSSQYVGTPFNKNLTEEEEEEIASSNPAHQRKENQMLHSEGAGFSSGRNAVSLTQVSIDTDLQESTLESLSIYTNTQPGTLIC